MDKFASFVFVSLVSFILSYILLMDFVVQTEIIVVVACISGIILSRSSDISIRFFNPVRWFWFGAYLVICIFASLKSYWREIKFIFGAQEIPAPVSLKKAVSFESSGALAMFFSAYGICFNSIITGINDNHIEVKHFIEPNQSDEDSLRIEELITRVFE
jgi:hypothetical protein